MSIIKKIMMIIALGEDETKTRFNEKVTTTFAPGD